MKQADQFDVIFSAEQIADRNEELAKEIAAVGYNDLLMIPILTGAMIFGADLMRALGRQGQQLQMDFMHLSSYGSQLQTTGRVKIIHDVTSEVAGRDILLVDDILESGLSLAFAREYLTKRGARTVDIAVLLEKKGKRKSDIEANFVGFECPDAFVIGYGMDAAGAWRELPYVADFGV